MNRVVTQFQPRTGSESVAQYRHIGPLGRSAVGEVSLVAVSGPPGLEQLAVVNRIWPELTPEPELVARFLDQLRSAQRLRHPNIIRTFSVGEIGEAAAGTATEAGGEPGCFVATEYLAGQSLAQILRRLRGSQSEASGFTLQLRLDIVVDVLRALEYAHDCKDRAGHPAPIIHGDINPANVLVSYDGVVKLMDFGLAAALSAAASTGPGLWQGRLAAIAAGAPEWRRGAGRDGRGDLFAVGLLLWELVAERPMFRGQNERAVQAALSGEAPLPGLPEGLLIPDELRLLCQRAVALAAEARPPTAGEFRRALEEILAGCLPPEPRPLGKVVASAFRTEKQSVEWLIERFFQHEPDPDDLPSVPGAGPALVDEDLPRAEVAAAPVAASLMTPPRPSYLTNRITESAPAIELADDWSRPAAPTEGPRRGWSQLVLVVGMLLAGAGLTFLFLTPARILTPARTFWMATFHPPAPPPIAAGNAQVVHAEAAPPAPAPPTRARPSPPPQNRAASVAPRPPGLTPAPVAPPPPPPAPVPAAIPAGIDPENPYRP